MKFRIINIDFLYNMDNTIEFASIRFDLSNEGFSINGVIKVSIDEYQQNCDNLQQLETLVKTKLAEKVGQLPTT